MAKTRRTNYDPQNNTQKTNYCAKRTPLKAQDELMCSGSGRGSGFTSGTSRYTVKQHTHHVIWTTC
jgi:hypothetical protein